MSVSSCEESEKLEKSEILMLGGAIGAPEARNLLGMLVVMSLQLSMAIGGTWTRFSGNLLYSAPTTIESYGEITTNIPNKFLASRAPMAPPSIRFSDFGRYTCPGYPRIEYEPI